MRGALLFSALALLCCGVFAGEQKLFALEVSPVEVAGKVILKVSMKNVSGAPRTVFSGALPWVDGVSGMQVSGYEGNVGSGDSKLRPMRTVGATLHGYEEVKLDANASVHGEINLEQRFPGINNTVKGNDVFIYWSYLPFDSNLTKGEELSGAVFFRSRRK